MDIWRSIRNAIPSVNSAGYPFIGGALAIAIVGGLLWGVIFWVFLGLTIWMVIFFRDPERIPPDGDDLVLAPADGLVQPIVEAVPPAELELGTLPLKRISIFLTIFDCHVNRSPVAGRIARIAYKPGKFVNADLDKASEDNERNGLLLDTGKHQVGVVQIAGLIARRIVCTAKEGEQLRAGERFGMIRFGSRLDVYLPVGTEVLIKPGQRAIAGETALARMSAVGAVRTPVAPLAPTE